MDGAQKIFNDIKKELKNIKAHGGHIDQYDYNLFDLFIKAYKNDYMKFECSPRLTAQAIIEQLQEDESYTNKPSKVTYDLDKYFYDKWRLWTEAFDKGFKGQYITWNSSGKEEKSE